MTGKDKIQYLLITYLLNHGSIDLKLPDGVDLEIGITQETKHGLKKKDDYCWVMASRNARSMILDSYNLGLKFAEDNSIVCEDKAVDKNGNPVKSLSVF
jgi:hypothetical protein